MQECAAGKERELREAEAKARAQQALTESAEADKIKLIAGGDAERAARIGIAEAMAIEEQVRAYGGLQLQRYT